jgi:hypothetical protein
MWNLADRPGNEKSILRFVITAAVWFVVLRAGPDALPAMRSTVDSSAPARLRLLGIAPAVAVLRRAIA